MQSFTITGRLPDLNTYILIERGNRYAAADTKANWTAIVANEIKTQKIKPVTMPLTLIITWYVKDKKRDKDNIMFGQKFILDGLVKAKVLKNDGWNDIADIEHNFILRRNEKEFVKIELL